MLHLSGHSTGDPVITENALTFGAEREWMTWRRLAAAPLSHGPVVVLAACDTLRAPPSPSHRSLSLGAAFIAAGAGDVIATTSPIADNDARLLFSNSPPQSGWWNLRGRSGAPRPARVHA